jgi:Putative Ig domain
MAATSPAQTPPPTAPVSEARRGGLKMSQALPPATVGVRYTGTVTVNSGRSPYKFDVVWGKLPTGLNLAATSGTIAGIPLKAGSFDFAVRVVDSQDHGGAQPYTIVVSDHGNGNGNPVTVSVTPSTATVASKGAVQLTALVTNSTNVGVTWTTSLGTISASGLYQAPIATSNASATVTATSVADPTKSATSAITITANVQTGGPGADYYVAPTGSDSNPGTVEAPFATVAKAQSTVRTVLLANHCGNRSTPIVVQLRGGMYASQSLSFTSADSGCSSTVPVVYQNYPGETPVLSGGRQVTGWTNVAGHSVCAGNSNCWQATLSSSTPYFEALFYNGQRRMRPRLGATATNLLGQYYRIKSSLQNCNGGTCYDRFSYNSSDPISGKWSNLSSPYPSGDIELIAFEKWTAPLERIKSIDTSANVIYLTGLTAESKDHGYLTNHRYIIENVKDLMQFPGQWFLDRSVSPWTVTYIANPGEDPNNDSVMIPQNAQVLSATGLQWVTFQGLQFEHDNYTVPTAGYASVQLDPTIPAMVHCGGCQNVVFDSNRFTQTTGVALDIVGTSTSDTVQDNLFYDIGAYGIRFGTAPAGGDTDSTVAHSLIATQNGIAAVGRVLPSSDGIVLGDVHDIDVSFNDIYDTYHDGVEMCRPSQGVCNGSSNSGGAFNLNIHDNNVHDVMQGVTNDGGCYYAMTAISSGSASGNKMTHNSCHDVSDASSQDSDGYGGHGIYLDSYTGSWDVEQNLIYRVSAVAFNMTQGPQSNGQANTFTNNIAAYARQAVVGVLGCPVALPLLQFTFTNNLIYQDRSNNSKPGTNLQKASEYFAGGAPTQTQKFANNVYWNSNGTLATEPHAFFSNTSSGCAGRNWMTFSQWQSFGEDSGSSVQNPVFVNPAYPADDFALTAGSPGTSAGFVPFGLTFGRTNPVAIPSVGGTFPTVIYNPASDF